ncbi:Protein of unknown function [Bacillus cereus]|nr:Protein of unknown function [Bacillus cereus]
MELDDKVYNQILQLCEEGDILDKNVHSFHLFY